MTISCRWHCGANEIKPLCPTTTFLLPALLPIVPVVLFIALRFLTSCDTVTLPPLPPVDDITDAICWCHRWEPCCCYRIPCCWCRCHSPSATLPLPAAFTIVVTVFIAAHLYAFSTHALSAPALPCCDILYIRCRGDAATALRIVVAFQSLYRRLRYLPALSVADAVQAIR